MAPVTGIFILHSAFYILHFVLHSFFMAANPSM
jgi:hypothetical protein